MEGKNLRQMMESTDHTKASFERSCEISEADAEPGGAGLTVQKANFTILRATLCLCQEEADPCLHA